MTNLKPSSKMRMRHSVSGKTVPTTAKAIATKAIQKVSQIAKRIPKTETKYANTGATAVSATNFNNSGQAFYLTGTAEGDGSQDRNGDEIQAKYLRFRMVVNKTLTGGSNQAQVWCRFILFIDKENRQSVPAVTNILDSASVTSQYNQDNINRFRILKDELFALDTYHNNRLVSYNGSLNHRIRYLGTTASVASADEGNIFFLVLSDCVVANDPPTAQYDSRLSFTDD